MKNLEVDIKIRPLEVDHIVPGGLIHTGFWGAWIGLRVSLRAEIKVGLPAKTH